MAVQDECGLNIASCVRIAAVCHDIPWCELAVQLLPMTASPEYAGCHLPAQW